MTSSFARGACPRLSEPMQTGDGLLARMVIAGRVPVDQLVALCASACEHGNGVIEISARGSLQVRGLTSHSAPLFAQAVSALDIDLCDGVPVVASPLQGDPAGLIDADALAADLRHAIAERHLVLAPKVSVVVDGGGALNLDALGADIRVRAVETAPGPLLHIALAGDASSATPLGLAAVDEAEHIAMELLAAIAALGPDVRAADLLHAKGIGGIRAALRTRIDPALALSARQPAEPIGLHRLQDGTHALGFGLAFGHARAGALIELADIARANGTQWARPAPDRTLLLGPLSEAKAISVAHAAEQLGFIVDARDPRRRVIACPGAPSCASGLIAARAIAAELAPHLPATLKTVHVSGCAKGCAHPAKAPLTIVGTSQGCGIIRDGTARDVPEAYVAPHDLPVALVRLIKTREAAHA
jgi:precorrin-3B synthase